MTIDLEHWRENPPTVCLLLTRRCNFQCGHCMYECGPSFRGYMKNPILSLVQNQVIRLLRLGIFPRINLIGGEPTLNMKRFGEILDRIMNWYEVNSEGVSVEMTTNGWWLHSHPKHTRAFIEAVRPYVNSDGMGIDAGFSVRISNDSHHDSFRPGRYANDEKALERRLASLWEFDEDGIFYKETPTCGSCGREFRWMPDDEICKCGGDVYYETEEICYFPPQPCDGDPWIYVERHGGHHNVIPVGRGAMWGQPGPGKPKCYHAGDALAYLPNGKLMDVCCKGSWCEFGDVSDDPLLLLELARRFANDAVSGCYGCRDEAKEWKRKHLRSCRATIMREIKTMEESDEHTID
jgi:hypothetical protein